jgi:hypothetical protein
MWNGIVLTANHLNFVRFERNRSIKLTDGLNDHAQYINVSMFICKGPRSAIDLKIFEDYKLIMNTGVLYEAVSDPDLPSEYYYAHISSLGLTTHGLGIAGTRKAALDLVRMWIAEKKTNGGQIVTKRRLA